MPTRLTLLWLLTLLAAVAAAPAAPAPTQPDILRPGEVLRGRFVQERQLSGFAKPLHSEGTFVLVPGRGLIWHAVKPFESITVIQPAGISVRANGQVTLNLPASRLPGISHLYDVLGGAVSGNTAALQQDFSIKRSVVSDGWRIDLVPLHPDNPAMAQIKSLVVTGHARVEAIEIDKGGGDVDRLGFIAQAATTGQPSADEAALLQAPHK